MEKIVLKLKSKRSAIDSIETYLNDINKSVGLDESKFLNFQIAVSEALINAIVHGNHESDSKIVKMEIQYNDNSITVKIKDEGTGFDINKLPDPTQEENLFKEHGRGIFIMKSLVDNFICNSDESGTEYILTIHK
jgi:serine/threonine-protein kinase RsbW